MQCPEIITRSPVDIDGALLCADKHVFLNRKATLVVAKLFSSIGCLSRWREYLNNHTWRVDDIVLTCQILWIATDGSVGKEIACARNTDTQIGVEDLTGTPS